MMLGDPNGHYPDGKMVFQKPEVLQCVDVFVSDVLPVLFASCYAAYEIDHEKGNVHILHTSRSPCPPVSFIERRMKIIVSLSHLVFGDRLLEIFT